MRYYKVPEELCDEVAELLFGLYSYMTDDEKEIADEFINGSYLALRYEQRQ